MDVQTILTELRMMPLKKGGITTLNSEYIALILKYIDELEGGDSIQ